MNKKIFTRQETAKILDVTVGTLANWESAGHLKAARIGHRVYYTQESINEALKINS